jgi:membrane protein YdbS with pleckstrin-like domain
VSADVRSWLWLLAAFAAGGVLWWAGEGWPGWLVGAVGGVVLGCTLVSLWQAWLAHKHRVRSRSR